MLIPSVPGHRLTGCQSNKLIHLQTVEEVLVNGKSSRPFEEVETNVLVIDSIVYFAIDRFVLISQQIVVWTRVVTFAELNRCCLKPTANAINRIEAINR